MDTPSSQSSKVHSSQPRVFLIGGPPGAGKTTLGCALAARIGGSSITADDLMTVAKTATTPESHPGLYLFRNQTYLEYFTNSTLEQLQRDAQRQHEAVWPFIKALIQRHFDWTTTPLVIDGWHLRPARIVELDLNLVDANFLHIAPAVLQAREAKNTDWLQGSDNPQQMQSNFVARSLWFNRMIKSEAEAFGMTVIEQDGAQSPEELCNTVLNKP